MGDFMFIQDISTPTGSRLFSGSKVYIYGAKVSETFKANIATSTKNMVETELTTADLVNGGVAGNYNRRLGNVTFGSLESPMWNIDGAWNYDEVDVSFTTHLANELILTPYKLKRFATSGHQLMIWDDQLIQKYRLGEKADTAGSPLLAYFYAGSGPPVTITGYKTTRVSKSDNIVFNITLQEDKADT